MAPSPIPVFRFDSGCLRPPQAFDLWRAILSEFYDVIPPPADDEGPFSAAIDVWNIGGVFLTNGVFSGQAFTRTAARVRRDGLDNYTILLHRTGTWRADVGTRTIASAAGRLCILDFGRAHASQVGRNDSITLSLPRDFLDEVLPPRDLHGLTLEGPQSDLFREFLLSLSQRLPMLTAEQAPFVAAASRDLLAACLTGSAEARERAQPQLDALGCRRGRKLIDANLHRPDWGVEDLRLALGVSRATLYRMFQHLGGVGAYIRARRLHRAHSLLVAASGSGRVSEVARRCGFSSEATFSRSFREAYGYAAREALDGGRPARARWTRGAARPALADGILEDWFRLAGA